MYKNSSEANQRASPFSMSLIFKRKCRNKRK